MIDRSKQSHAPGKPMSEATTIEPLIIRLPAQLKQKLKERAKTNHRNMNGEVVALIEAATRTEDQKKDLTT